MHDLYEITTAQAIEESVKVVMDKHPELTKKMAKILVTNALIYNCVIEEVVGQVDFLMGCDDLAGEE
jgi:hypothetical protein